MDIKQARQYFEDRCKAVITEFATDEEQALAELREALAVFDELVRVANERKEGAHE